MDPITLLLLLGGVLLTTTIEGFSSANQLKAQREANEKNIELQQMINEAQMQQVQATNEFNAAEAQKQRDWETYMSNTAVQRSMADYSAAGLNPLMAVPGGAAVPSGASAQGNVANLGAAKVSPAALNLSGISSAIQSMTNFMLTAKLLGTKEVANAINAQNADTRLGSSLHWNDYADSKAAFYNNMRSNSARASVRGYRG